MLKKTWGGHGTKAMVCFQEETGEKKWERKAKKTHIQMTEYLSAGLCNTVVYLSKLASEQPKKFSVSFPNKYNLYTSK